MSGTSTVALLGNIRIDDSEKLEFLKVTATDASGVFGEAHFKIRGRLAAEAVAILKGVPFGKLFLYQDLREDDWIAATSEMLESVRARAVFLFFEDHRLVATAETLKSVLEDFEALNLDYLCYSWFRASKLGPGNVLPFYSSETPNLVAVEFTPRSIGLLGRISPRYYVFSLVSVISLRYLKSLLAGDKAKKKLYSRRGTALASRLFPYPRYRRAFHVLNRWLSPLGASACIYEPSSPFNTEKMWWEFVPPAQGLKVGIAKKELLANYDDDNGADGESLIKRGLYPFVTEAPDPTGNLSGAPVRKTLDLPQGRQFDLLYCSPAGRIRRAPVVHIEVKSGRVVLKWPGSKVLMRAGDKRSVYSNKGATLLAEKASVLEFQIFDELFQEVQ